MIMFIVASLAVMLIHCCILFEQKVSRDGLLWGGGIKSILQHLYLIVYAEFNNKIYMIIIWPVKYLRKVPRFKYEQADILSHSRSWVHIPGSYQRPS